MRHQQSGRHYQQENSKALQAEEGVEEVVAEEGVAEEGVEEVEVGVVGKPRSMLPVPMR
jgi:hypothetical protein